MMKVEGTTIHLTRGDVGSICVSAKTPTGDAYTFVAGDVVRFQVMKKKQCNEIVIKKTVTISKETESVTIDLTSADTRVGKIISEKEKYWYEVELNPDTNPQTIIGYDEHGAKELVLYPEGDDSNG